MMRTNRRIIFVSFNKNRKVIKLCQISYHQLESFTNFQKFLDVQLNPYKQRDMQAFLQFSNTASTQLIRGKI